MASGSFELTPVSSANRSTHDEDRDEEVDFFLSDHRHHSRSTAAQDALSPPGGGHDLGRVASRASNAGAESYRSRRSSVSSHRSHVDRLSRRDSRRLGRDVASLQRTRSNASCAVTEHSVDTTDAYSGGGAGILLNKGSASVDRRRSAAHTSIDASAAAADDDNDSHRSFGEETDDDVCFPTEAEQMTGINFEELDEFCDGFISSINHPSPLSPENRPLLAFGGAQARVRRGSHVGRDPLLASEHGHDHGRDRIPEEQSPAPLVDTGALISTTESPTHDSTGSEETVESEEKMTVEEMYLPSDSDDRPQPEGTVSFGPNQIERTATERSNNMDSRSHTTSNNNNSNSEPARFSLFFSKAEETIHAPDLPSLLSGKNSFKELFNPKLGMWWLNCFCPTDLETKVLARAFGIHPLTAEDIRLEESREKVELFHSYYFVSFHTFEDDPSSENYLEPINFYIVVFKEGILTFHYSEIPNCVNVRRRVRQLRDYVQVTPDWICYALIDDITDCFAPFVHEVEIEADMIEDSVFVARREDISRILQRISDARRKTMLLMRLLSGKAGVINMFAKRCKDMWTSSPDGDIALYLGDIQDHILTMSQNLASYEKIMSRSHSNYLAQLQVESVASNNRMTQLLGKATLLGTILVPMNLITGMFGMNVRVPGADVENLHWFFSILAVMVVTILGLVIGANYYINYTAGRAQREAEMLPAHAH